ncbi:doubtful CDS, hypothetical protein [Streptomyces coelicolor A3(2)]|uniref:Uncharacterized protein n=2 Tax=Streptomyces coelicolor TaxID=1902 RepID=Q99Q75_STRCO|nr:hypothetical protein [Streptomyces coelicolor]CAC36592.1 doubtful CDS, hypothetical protein [Streptomyces coelicolor A3(2)]CAC36809.1 doubtful CDS, hypothetical protein [Streptomyces coelicolor A3(2)]
MQTDLRRYDFLTHPVFPALMPDAVRSMVNVFHHPPCFSFGVPTRSPSRRRPSDT